MPKTGDGSGKATGGKMTSLASSLAGKAPSVSRVGSGVQGAVQRVKERPGVSSSADAIERRSEPQYRELLNAAARKSVEAQKAMRDRKWKPQMGIDAAQAELEVMKYGKSIGLSQYDISNDLRTMSNLRY